MEAPAVSASVVDWQAIFSPFEDQLIAPLRYIVTKPLTDLRSWSRANDASVKVASPSPVQKSSVRAWILVHHNKNRSAPHVGAARNYEKRLL